MNAKPRWTAFLCILAYCAVAVLALNSYQGRLRSVAEQRRTVDRRLVAKVAIAADTQQPQPTAAFVAQVANKSAQMAASPPEMASIVPQTLAPVVADNPARVQCDGELLGCLAAELARTAMKEGSVVLPRQIVEQEPKRSPVPAKLASFRLPRSTPKIEPPQPASLLVNYQSRLLAAATEVRTRVNTYLRWVRLCAAVRDLLSDFEKAYLNPGLDRVLQRQSAVEVLFDLDYRTYDLSRYAFPIA